VLLLKWSLRLIFDTVRMGLVNGSLAMSVGILLILLGGLLIGAAQISAPYIYTLF